MRRIFLVATILAIFAVPPQVSLNGQTPSKLTGSELLAWFDLAFQVRTWYTFAYAPLVGVPERSRLDATRTAEEEIAVSAADLGVVLEPPPAGRYASLVRQNAAESPSLALDAYNRWNQAVDAAVRRREIGLRPSGVAPSLNVSRAREIGALAGAVEQAMLRMVNERGGAPVVLERQKLLSSLELLEQNLARMAETLPRLNSSLDSMRTIRAAVAEDVGSSRTRTHRDLFSVWILAFRLSVRQAL